MNEPDKYFDFFSSPAKCQPHMNDLPVPCGPWDPWYRQKQSFYMKHLLFGLAWYVIQIFKYFKTFL